MNIRFLTSNEGKAKEIEAILNEDNTWGFNVRADKVKGMPKEIQGTFEEILTQKLLDARRLLKERKTDENAILMVDDTGIVLELLDYELPGPYTKDRARDVDGRECYERLLVRPCMLSGITGAKARTYLGLSIPGEDPIVRYGEIEGSIVRPRGTNGFGWDNVFKPLDGIKTFAEMSDAEKNAISMRALAAVQIRDYLLDKLADAAANYQVGGYSHS